MDSQQTPSIRRKSSNLFSPPPQLPSSTLSPPPLRPAILSDPTLLGVSALENATESLRRTVEKRITTWTYLRKACDGNVHWFDTILLSQPLLLETFPPSSPRIKTRTIRLTILGMSLSSLLEITSASDFLRGLLSLLNEYDTLPSEKEREGEGDRPVDFGPGGGAGGIGTERKGKIGMFRSRTAKGRLNAAGLGLGLGQADYAGGLGENEVSYLLVPNIPFELDYFQVLFTTCDMIVETYEKIKHFLSPPGSSLPISTSTTSLPPSGSPSPASSSLNLLSSASGQGANRTDTGSGERLQVPGEKSGVGGLSPNLVEVVLKVDSKFKKILKTLTGELDAAARKAIREELKTLDPMALFADYGMNEY
ncbi:hypothetical protein BT69DRAFT_1283280 [Atractiella rhizophila]|nr:hypothetical protein BT69DRAFT_1283280 [Atractiella rhizophila]